MTARGPRVLIPSGLLLVVVAMLVTLTGTANRSSPAARLVLAGVIAAVIADGWLAYRALRHLTTEVSTPALATRGTTFDAQARIDGVRRPSTVDPLFAEQEPQPFVSGVPFALSCLPSYRGVFNHLLVEVRCRSPLGLWVAARRVAVHLPRPLAVAPEPRPVDVLGAPGPASPSFETAGTRRSGHDLTRSVREYLPGDSSRLVHWPATANRGRLMVRETETDRGPLPVVIVDVRGPGPAAEHAMGRAARYGTDAVTEAGRVRLITVEPADPLSLPIPRGVLMPGAALRVQPTATDAVVVIDAIEDSIDRVHHRLAAATAAPLEATGAGLHGTWVTDEGDHRGPASTEGHTDQTGGQPGDETGDQAGR